MKNLEQKIEKNIEKPDKLKSLIAITTIAFTTYLVPKFSPVLLDHFNNSFRKNYQIHQMSQEIGGTPYNLSNPAEFNSFQTKYGGKEYTIRLNGDGLSYSRIEILDKTANKLLSSYHIEGSNVVGILPLEESSIETKTNESNGIYFEIFQKDPKDPFSTQFVKTIYIAKF